MTTIAIDTHGTIAWDSQVTTDGIKEIVARSKVSIEKGWIIGYAGDYSLRTDVIKWFLKGCPIKKTPEGSWGLIACKKGVLTFVNTSNARPHHVSPPFAVGSGDHIALTAMRLGKTAREAVEIAAEMDIFTGPPIHSWNMSEVVKKKPKVKRTK